jgi:hypothetical protein
MPVATSPRGDDTSHSAHPHRWPLAVARTPGRRALVVAGLAAAVIAPPIVLPAAAGASPATVVVARLSLTGIVTSSVPRGGTILAIKPGETVDFRAGTIPLLERTAAGKLVTYRITLDSSGLPGGSRSVRVSTTSPYRLSFRKPGVYALRWQTTVVRSRGDRERKKGKSHDTEVKAQEQSSAEIVVSNSPVKKSEYIELPDVSVKVAVPFGALPKITIPGPVINPASVPSVRSTPAGSGASPTPGLGQPPAGGTVSPSGPPHAQGGQVEPKAPPSHTARGPRSAQPSHPPLASTLQPTPVSTYVFTGIAGFILLGLFWLLWASSIRLVLGR